MQTFLPTSNLNSIRYLDPDRIGNQVYRECKTILSGGWKNHPATKMWKGYEVALCIYALHGLVELKERGKEYPKWFNFYGAKAKEFGYPEIVLPHWLGDERLHSSHRAALLYKNPEWYGDFDWKEEPQGPNKNGEWNYFWPC